MAKKRIHELDLLATPTDGWEIIADKVGEASAKKAALSSLMRYDTGSGYLGCTRDLMLIGTWPIKSQPLRTITIPDPSSVIALGNIYINDDDDKQYMNTLWDDSFFLNNTSYIGTSGQNAWTGISGNANAGTTDTSNTGVSGGGNSATPKTIARGISPDLNANQCYMYYPFESNQYSIEKMSDGAFRLYYPVGGGGNIRITVISGSEGGQPTMYTVRDYSTYYLISFHNENGTGDATPGGIYFEIISAFDTDAHSHDVAGTHTHNIGAHTHNISISGSVLVESGANGANIQVFGKWDAIQGKVYLTHNYLGVPQGNFNGFGIHENASYPYLSRYANIYKNRGYIEIIRKFA